MINNDVDIAWAAGLFEGEGCIYLGDKAKVRRQRALMINMTDRDVLERFHEIVDCGTVKPIKINREKYPHWKPQWVWRANAWPDIVDVLLTFLPHLCGRRREKALALLADPPRDPNAPRKTHCLRGHPLSGPDADVYVHPDRPGHRICRACVRARKADDAPSTLFELPAPEPAPPIRAARPPRERRMAGECSACADGHCRSCSDSGCQHECDLAVLL